MTDDEVLERLLADPRLLRLPLVRYGQEVTVGIDEEAWRRWQPRTLMPGRRGGTPALSRAAGSPSRDLDEIGSGSHGL